MNPRILLAPVLLAASVAPAAAQQQGFQTRAFLIFEEGESQEVWLVAASATGIRFRETEQGVDTVDLKISDTEAIYIIEPREYSQAVDLYQSRKYEEAKAKFAEIKERHKSLQTLPNNFATLSAFYELECMRRLGDLEGLAAGLEKFIKDPLTRPNQLRQIEIYVFWDAVRTKSWARLDTLAQERLKEKLPGYQRAQVAYCHGLALEGLGKKTEALNAYNIALTADAAGSEDIARNAATNILRIHNADPEVQLAIKLWGTPDENPNAMGRARLLEASAVAHLYQISFGAGVPLPKEYTGLLKYKTEAEKEG
jgi:hypothetical protein